MHARCNRSGFRNNRISVQHPFFEFTSELFIRFLGMTKFVWRNMHFCRSVSIPLNFSIRRKENSETKKKRTACYMEVYTQDLRSQEI